jgi:hypothetical protein
MPPYCSTEAEIGAVYDAIAEIDIPFAHETV